MCKNGWCARFSAVLLSLVLAFPAYAIPVESGTGDGSYDERSEEGSRLRTELRKIKASIKEKIWIEVQGSLIDNLKESEAVSKYVNPEFWNELKDGWQAELRDTLKTDEFFQMIIPIAQDVLQECKDAMAQVVEKLRIKELTSLSKEEILALIATEAEEAIEKGITRVNELKEKEGEKFAAFTEKVKEVGSETSDTLWVIISIPAFLILFTILHYGTLLFQF